MARRKDWLLIGTIPVCLLAVYFMRGPAYSLGLQAIHGDSTQCGDLQIRIPRGWWATSDGKGVCVLLTQWPQYTFRDQKTIQVAFHLNRDAPSPTDEQWREDVVNGLTAEGYVVRSQKPMRVAGKDAFCIESHQAGGELADHVFCNVEQTMIVHFTYDGDPKLMAEFYRILASIS